jgi:ribose 5-phosphate isomerase A
MAAPDVLVRLQALGSPNPLVRSGLASKAGECVTDNGLWSIDAPFPPLLLPKDGAGDPAAGLWEVSKLAAELLAIPGIVEIGLFHGVNGDQAVGTTLEGKAQKPVAAYFGTAEGTVDVQRAA